MVILTDDDRDWARALAVPREVIERRVRLELAHETRQPLWSGRAIADYLTQVLGGAAIDTGTELPEKYLDEATHIAMDLGPWWDNQL